MHTHNQIKQLRATFTHNPAERPPQPPLSGNLDRDRHYETSLSKYGRPLTKAQALQGYRETLASIAGGMLGRIDRPMRAQGWALYIDALLKDGQITHKQATTWTNPWH